MKGGRQRYERGQLPATVGIGCAARYALGTTTHCRRVTVPSMTLQVTQYFPRGPESSSFKWKDYCPTVFQRLRQMYGIDNKDYLLSLTGDR